MGLSQPAVHKALAAGYLDTHPDGSINLDGEATRAWLGRDHPPRGARPEPSRNPGTRAPDRDRVEPQIEALLAKARWQEAWCERQEDSHYDRADLALACRANALGILAKIPTLPERYAAWLAEAIGRPEPVARRLLERVASVLLAEVESFPDEAEATAVRLP